MAEFIMAESDSPTAQDPYVATISAAHPAEPPTPSPYKPFLSGKQKLMLGFVVLSAAVWYYKRKDLF